MEDLAAKIEGVLGRISEGEICMNSGRTWRGYREPEEAAAEIFSEALQPARGYFILPVSIISTIIENIETRERFL